MPFVSLACCFLVPYIETWWHWPIFHEVWISYQFPALSLLETCQIFDIPALCSSMPTQWHMFLPPCLDLLAPSFMSWFKVYRNQKICISHHISLKSIVSCFRHFQIIHCHIPLRRHGFSCIYIYIHIHMITVYLYNSHIIQYFNIIYNIIFYYITILLYIYYPYIYIWALIYIYIYTYIYIHIFPFLLYYYYCYYYSGRICPRNPYII